jgi:chromosomal replication initiation ATPase DnaA
MTRIITDETHALRRRVARLEAQVLDLRAALGRLSPITVAHKSPPDTRAEIMAIVDTVAQAHGLSHADILGPSRYANIVRARHECFGMASEDGFTATEIGRAMNRDHTSVLNGVRKWKSAS